jgi:seryl-tRNA synthetase
MGFPIDLGKSIRKGLEVAREKGEQLARFSQLKLDVVNLNRERDSLYGRLGKAYVEGKGATLSLEPIVAEIERVSKEIEEREEALKNLGQQDEHAGSDTGTPGVPATHEAAATGGGETVAETTPAVVPEDPNRLP